MVPAHSEKEALSPISRASAITRCWAYCDNTGEPLAGMLRKGSAGSNTVADHLDVLGAAVTALPPAHRRRLMVTCDGASASHGLIERLDALAARPGHHLVYSVGWELGERERTAITAVPEAAWQIASSTAADRSASAAPNRPAPTAAARTGNAGSKKPTSPS